MRLWLEYGDFDHGLSTRASVPHHHYGRADCRSARRAGCGADHHRVERRIGGPGVSVHCQRSAWSSVLPRRPSYSGTGCLPALHDCYWSSGDVLPREPQAAVPGAKAAAVGTAIRHRGIPVHALPRCAALGHPEAGFNQCSRLREPDLLARLLCRHPHRPDNQPRGARNHSRIADASCTSLNGSMSECCRLENARLANLATTRHVTDTAPAPERLFEGFENLMPFRVSDILLVSSLYDSFILREDGRLNELLIGESLELNLHQDRKSTRL